MRGRGQSGSASRFHFEAERRLCGAVKSGGGRHAGIASGLCRRERLKVCNSCVGPGQAQWANYPQRMVWRSLRRRVIRWRSGGSAWATCQLSEPRRSVGLRPMRYPHRLASLTSRQFILCSAASTALLSTSRCSAGPHQAADIAAFTKHSLIRHDTMR